METITARFTPEHLAQLDGYAELLQEIEDLKNKLVEVSSKAWHRFPAQGDPPYLISQTQIDEAIANGLDYIRIEFPEGTIPYVPGKDMLFVDVGGMANQDLNDVYREVPGGMAIDLLIYESNGELFAFDGLKVRVRWYA